ncbi:unnamed protein product, partial [Ixodes persulcatus]
MKPGAWACDYVKFFQSEARCCLGKYDNGVERREGVICVGKRMDIDLEKIVTDCLHSRYRIANIPASELFDMLCDDDSRRMDRVYDCVDDQADDQGDRDWSLDEVTKFMQ